MSSTDCPSCGNPIDPAWQHCLHCGRTLLLGSAKRSSWIDNAVFGVILMYAWDSCLTFAALAFASVFVPFVLVYLLTGSALAAVVVEGMFLTTMGWVWTRLQGPRR